MDIKTMLSISDARKKIFDITKDVQKPNRHYTLTDKGRPKAVIMSAEQYESWVETLEVMKDFPDLKKDITEAHREYRQGKFVAIEDILVKEGYIPKDKSKAIHGLSSRHSRKGKQRS